MRIRTNLLSLAVIALAALPVAAETPRSEPSPTAASITLPDSSALLDSVSITIAPEYEMSFTNSASGSKAQVLATCAAWAGQIAAGDVNFSNSEPVKAAHQAQIAGAVASVEKIVEHYPEGTVFSFSLSGSISTDGRSSGYVNLGFFATLPAPVSVGSGG